VLATVAASIVTWRRVKARLQRGGLGTAGPTLAADEPSTLECGYPVRTGLVLPRLWWIPFVDLTWTWVEPEAEVSTLARRHGVEEEVVAHRRGVVERIARRFEVGDIFGLTRVRFVVREHRRVRFAPSAGALKQIEVVRGMSGGDDVSHPEGPPDGEPFDMRRYNPGDPIRFVLWKVFARSRLLVVRTPERAISPARQTVAYLVTGKSDEPAAGAARVAVEVGALGRDWVLGADGVKTLATSREQALDVLARSATAPPEASGAGLAAFLERAASGSFSRAVVFVPAVPGPWIDEVLAAVRARKGRVEFVVGIDGVVSVPKQGWLRILSRRGDPRAAGALGGPVRADELAAVVKALSGARTKVVVVDRSAGRIYTSAHLEGLEDAA
jgi:uncharacterized protein (DUF58 family)